MNWIGAPLPRREDDRLLRGRGRYVDDIRLVGECHAVFLRSPHAHAEIDAIDVGEAAVMPGVLAIFTGEDVARWGLGPLPCAMRPQPKSGTTMCRPPRPALATGRVRYVGEAIRSEEHTSELQSLMRISYAVFCLKKKNK